MRDAARRLVAYDGSALRASALGAGHSARENRDSSAWLQEAESLSLVLDASRFEALLAEAAHWADRISACVTASQTERGNLPWWGELLARSTKCDRIYLRRGEQAEGWLLHRLHDTGALRLLDGGVKQVAGNLLLFARAGEIRALLAHIPLEHALSGAPFGALLSFRGGASGDFARACRAQLESSARLARIPTGSDIDALVLDGLQKEPRHAFSPEEKRWHVVSDPERLEACVQRLMLAIAADTAPTPVDPGVNQSGTELVDTAVDGSWGVSVRRLEDGYRVALQHRDTARLPFVLTLCAGSASAACNASLLEASDGQLVLVWRGGLLGHSRSRGELLWSAARLEAFSPEAFSLEAGFDAAQRLAVVAHTGAALRPQLSAFARETYRLGEVFGVEPAPTLGHALADFAALSPKQQTLLLWRALIGLGALDFGVATLTAARSLCDQGYLRGPGAEPGSYAALAELLARASESGSSFDRPGLGKIRAIQPDRGAYVFHDWLECLIQALPENEVVAQRTALRLAFERARDCFGLHGERLSRGSTIEAVLEGTLASAVRRGFVRRVGAGGVRRVSPLDATPDALPDDVVVLGQSRDGLLAGWCRALASSTPVQRLILTRRCGYYCRRETLDSVAQRLGLTVTLAQQLEAEAWQRVETESDWLEAVRVRIAKALGGTRVLPMRLLLLDDPWWQGIDQHLELIEALFERLGDAPMYCLELGALPRREVVFASVTRAEVDAALEVSFEQARLIPTPARIDDYQGLVRLAADALDGDLVEYLRDELEAHFELDAADPTRVLGLISSTTEGSGPLSSAVPSEAQGVDSEARLRLEDAVRSAFRSARTPLPFSGVVERIRQRIDVDEAVLAALLASAPFVQRNADQYGLLSRDVPGGHEAIAGALNSLVEALDESQRALSVEAAFALVRPALKQPWSIELMRSLIGSEPALCMSSSGEISLRRWGQGRALSSGKLTCVGIPALARPRFDQLCQGPLCKPGDLVGRVRAESSRLERALDADDFVAVSLVRQLGELLERLLEQVSQKPAHVQQLAEAATRYFLAAVAGDEDDVEVAAVGRDTLAEARAVLVAVLRQLELDWV